MFLCYLYSLVLVFFHASTTEAVDSPRRGLISSQHPQYSINISSIAANAGPVKGHTLADLISAFPINDSNTISTSRLVKTRLFRRAEDNTAWGTHRLVDPAVNGADTITMEFEGGGLFGTSIKTMVLSKHICRGHPLKQWLFVEGPVRDTTVLEAFMDVYLSIFPPEHILELIKMQTIGLLQSAQAMLDSVVAEEFYHQEETRVIGQWLLVVTTIEDEPGYSYAVSNANPSILPETQDERAIGAATLMVAISILQLTQHELNYNPAPMHQYDFYFVKVLLDCLKDMIAHGEASIQEGGGLAGPPWVSVQGVRLALGQLGRGTIGGVELDSRFLTTQHYHTQIQQDLDCSTGSDSGSESSSVDANSMGRA